MLASVVVTWSLRSLTEEAVGLVAAVERHDDVAAQLVIDPELHGVGEHADRTGVGGFGDELFGIEVDIDAGASAARSVCAR